MNEEIFGSWQRPPRPRALRAPMEHPRCGKNRMNPSSGNTVVTARGGPWRTFSSKLVLFFHSPAGGIYDPMKEKGFDIRFSSNNRVTPWVTSGLSLSP